MPTLKSLTPVIHIAATVLIPIAASVLIGIIVGAMMPGIKYDPRWQVFMGATLLLWALHRRRWSGTRIAAITVGMALLVYGVIAIGWLNLGGLHFLR